MTSGGVLGEILAVADQFRGHAAEAFGPYANVVKLAGQGMAAAIALLLLGAGRGLWAPPGSKLRNLAPRAAGLLAVVALLLLYLLARNPLGSVTPLRVAIGSTAALVVFGAFYAVLYQRLTFRCPHVKEVYVRGFFVTKDAQGVLNNADPSTLPADRKITGVVRPRDAQHYFCGIDRNHPEFVWTAGSLDAAKLVLNAAYVPFAISIIVLLASSAFALQEAQVVVTEDSRATIVRVPADLLFDFERAEIKDRAVTALREIATLIRERPHAGPIVIAGYTDGKGSDSLNLRLSRDRAAGVAQWLATEGGLAVQVFKVEAHGKQDPIAPNTFPDESDNPEGRRLNRRVVVSIPKVK